MKPVNIPPDVAQLSSKEWYSANYGDYLLLEASSQSLDLTIEAIGRERFNKALEAFETMKKLADEQCADSVIPPCSPTGVYQINESQKNCYFLDMGCGYPCFDDLFEPSELNFDASEM